MNGAWKAKKINFSDINELDKANGLMLCYGFLRESESLLIQNKQIFDKCVEFADIGLDIGLDINVDINALEIEKKKKNLLKYNSKKAISWKPKKENINGTPILNVGSAILIVISIPLLLFGTDISMLVINEENNCNEALPDESIYVSFDLNSFILFGCIGHLVFIVCLCCFSVFALMTGNIGKDDPNLLYKEYVSRLDKRRVKPCFYVYVGCGCGMVCFFLSWAVIGFLLYSEMSKDTQNNKKCADVLLAGSILRTLEEIGTPIVGWGYLAIMGMEDDD
eukprot:41318_1